MVPMPRHSSFDGLHQALSDRYVGVASSRQLRSLLDGNEPYGHYATERQPPEADLTRRGSQLASLPQIENAHPSARRPPNIAVRDPRRSVIVLGW